MKFFTHYWSSKWFNDEAMEKEGEPMDHIAGEIFRKRGVEVGDIVYIVSLYKKNLHLLGRIFVDYICDQKEACKILGTDNLWEAKDHIICRYEDTLPIRFNRIIDIEVVRNLDLFNSKGEIVKPKFKSELVIDQQTFRGIREITENSARILDEIIGDELIFIPTPSSIDKELFPEGGFAYKIHKFYERNPQVVKLAKEKRMSVDPELKCEICGFSFRNIYKELGENYIEAHHIIPVSEAFETRETKIEDLALVCSNCHRMLHRCKSGTSIEELKKIISS